MRLIFWQIERVAEVGSLHSEFFVEPVSTWAFAVRGQRQLVASAAARDLERRFHQPVTDPAAATA